MKVWPIENGAFPGGKREKDAAGHTPIQDYVGLAHVWGWTWSRAVEGHGLSRLELFLAGRRTRTKAMRRGRPFAKAVQAPKFLAEKTLVPPSIPTLTLIASPNTQDQWTSDDDDDGRLYTKARCTPYLTYNPGIMQGLCMWYWTSVRSGGCWIVRSARRPPP